MSGKTAVEEEEGGEGGGGQISVKVSPMRILTGLFVVNLDRTCEKKTPIVSQVAPSSS